MDFRVDVGELTLVGPWQAQSFTCIAGRLCDIDGFMGQNPEDGDRLLLMDTCGASSIRSEQLQTVMHGVSPSSSEIVSQFRYGKREVTAKGGAYRMCWCSTHFSCSQQEIIL